jgi:tetratricopeptide (TPR) repeat protein
MQGGGDHSSPYPQLQAEGPLAINKRKILQSAQKHMQKGALDKALKDYASLLKADPNDINIRLKVGDICLKQGKTDDAVSSYLKVAQQFMKDGFDSKAIALYKQVTKIDPKRHDVYLPLSELYQRLGLNSDALKALQTAADAFYREGDKDRALDLLRKMANFDPSNTTNRLRVAELLRQEGREAEALAEYDEVAGELERQGDPEGRVKVFYKII